MGSRGPWDASFARASAPRVAPHAVEGGVGHDVEERWRARGEGLVEENHRPVGVAGLRVDPAIPIHAGVPPDERARSARSVDPHSQLRLRLRAPVAAVELQEDGRVRQRQRRLQQEDAKGTSRLVERADDVLV
jgi:hypothetical protein